MYVPLPTIPDELRSASRLPIFDHNGHEPDWLRYRMEHDAHLAHEKEARRSDAKARDRGGLARVLRAAIGRA